MKLDGLTKDWRFDRMATVVHPGTGAVTARYAAIAKAWSKKPTTAPRNAGRSLPEDITAATAQASLDEFCEQITDQRPRIAPDGNRCTVTDLAAAEPFRPVPPHLPVAVTRKASAQALLSYRGNTYSVPPAHATGKYLLDYWMGAIRVVLTYVANRFKRPADASF
ncbi:hypothetical protein [Mycobacterium sp.]|uniref:hypothetical protein n=1 Tax=Mycobacterium sp. TaxID=1785 RepID=UPI003BAD1D2D